MSAQPTTEDELNRALLARQGLLDPLTGPVAGVVASIGAIQAQNWPAVPLAIATRTSGVDLDAVRAALAGGTLLYSTLLRGTLHVVSADEYPAYAAVAIASGAVEWRRKSSGPAPLMDQLLDELRTYADSSREVDDVVAFIDSWVEAHPDAAPAEEIEFQRQYKWRPFRGVPALVRAPVDGEWGAKVPDGLRAAPPAMDDPAKALSLVVRAHLRAFGPAAADDVATWIGWKTPPVREALDTMDLPTFTLDGKRLLYDLPDSPRPSADVDAPPRLLPAFDSTLLAYATKHRTRILPTEHRDAVYLKANLQIRPSFLVDGRVAGTWALELKRKIATATLRPLTKLTSAARAGLVSEAERLARFAHPDAKDHTVTIES